jgi:hypothetical protein
VNTIAQAPKPSGRLLAWTALLVALAASVAANVAYAQPSPGPRLSAGVAPVLVVLAAGLLERVPLSGIAVWRRLLAYGGLSVIVAAAFTTSFEHQYRLLLAYGNPVLSAMLLPIAVDGLIVLASVCLTVIAERRRVLPETAQTTAPKRTARATRTVRRPVAESQQLLRELLADDPGTPTDSLARSLGITERRVRQLLSQPATTG